MQLTSRDRKKRAEQSHLFRTRLSCSCCHRLGCSTGAVSQAVHLKEPQELEEASRISIAMTLTNHRQKIEDVGGWAMSLAYAWIGRGPTKKSCQQLHKAFRSRSSSGFKQGPQRIDGMFECATANLRAVLGIKLVLLYAKRQHKEQQQRRRRQQQQQQQRQRQRQNSVLAKQASSSSKELAGKKRSQDAGVLQRGKQQIKIKKTWKTPLVRIAMRQDGTPAS